MTNDSGGLAYARILREARSLVDNTGSAESHDASAVPGAAFFAAFLNLGPTGVPWAAAIFLRASALNVRLGLALPGKLAGPIGLASGYLWCPHDLPVVTCTAYTESVRGGGTLSGPGDRTMSALGPRFFFELPQLLQFSDANRLPASVPHPAPTG